MLTVEIPIQTLFMIFVSFDSRYGKNTVRFGFLMRLAELFRSMRRGFPSDRSISGFRFLVTERTRPRLRLAGQVTFAQERLVRAAGLRHERLEAAREREDALVDGDVLLAGFVFVEPAGQVEEGHLAEHAVVLVTPTDGRSESGIKIEISTTMCDSVISR